MTSSLNKNEIVMKDTIAVSEALGGVISVSMYSIWQFTDKVITRT